MDDKTKSLYNNIIKYNTSRRYFGRWTPKELSDSYSLFEKTPLSIGILSIDDICDTLWNEMSYNPKRFGTKSPFEINGKNELYKFVDDKFDTPDATMSEACFETLSDVHKHLSAFWNLIINDDDEFPINRVYKYETVIIEPDFSIINGNKPAPNIVYTMLSELRRSVKAIAQQNLADFHKKRYFDSIVDVINQRHPDLIRPTKIENFAKKQRELQKLGKCKDCIEKAIQRKTSQICATQMHIDNLSNEFENPGDTSIETAHLNKQNKDLQKLEFALQNVNQKIINLKNTRVY